MSFRLTTISFRAAPQSERSAAPLTILVGPNNSGKSLALREIMQWAKGDDNPRSVVGDLDVEWPQDPAEVLTQLQQFETEPNPGEAPQLNSILIAPFRLDGSQERSWLNRETLANQLPQGSSSAWLRQMVLGNLTARLDGRTRFDLMAARGFQDLQLPPQHHLAALFKDDAQRARVRELVSKAFPGKYFVIDPTSMQQFRVRISDRPPADSAEERNWDARAIRFHGNAEPIEQLSDGVVSFTGLVAAVLSLRHRILLVDEPEAFLHPPLARLLGANLASLTQEREASMVVATHSAEFVMGCMESGVDATIVRLTYEQGVSGARMLAPGELKELIRHPLLRSTRALTGLFHRGVIVAESDHDRAFYDEVNRRLLEADRGASDSFFTNAQNWQTIPRVVAPLRKLGVPAVAIVDLDCLLGTRTEWNKFYEAADVQGADRDDLDGKRSSVAAKLRGLPVNSANPSFKRSGISALAESDRPEAEALVEQLGSYGIFVVPTGELESWLPSLDVSRGRGKANWIVSTFDKLGTRPEDSNYVEAGNDDVWAFMDKVASWVNDPNRQGLPTPTSAGGNNAESQTEPPVS